MSENSNMRASQLKGISYFFTEPDKVEQSVDPILSHSFGPIGISETERQAQFRLGAKMKLKAGNTLVKAFAICSGNVLLQPQTGNSNKVNLILRPLSQPFNGMPVKYFIYRGLDYSDFLMTGDDTKLALTGPEFITSIRTAFSNFNDLPLNSEMSSAWIGYNLGTDPNIDLIDDMFFRISPEDEDVNSETKVDELAFAKEGMHLGHFSADFQLDIVLGSPDRKQLISSTGLFLNIAFARVAESKIIMADKPANYPDRAYREAILDFIDPAAYWGMHMLPDSKLMVYAGTNWSECIGVNIYESVLMCYANPNTNYLYLRGRTKRSYGYYGNNSLSIRNQNDVLLTESYSTNSWPYFSFIQIGDQLSTEGFIELRFPIDSGIQLIQELTMTIDSDAFGFAHPKISEDDDTLLIKIRYEILNHDLEYCSHSFLFSLNYYEYGITAEGVDQMRLSLTDKDFIIQPVLEVGDLTFGSGRLTSDSGIGSVSYLSGIEYRQVNSGQFVFGSTDGIKDLVLYKRIILLERVIGRNFLISGKKSFDTSKMRLEESDSELKGYCISKYSATLYSSELTNLNVIYNTSGQHPIDSDFQILMTWNEHLLLLNLIQQFNEGIAIGIALFPCEEELPLAISELGQLHMYRPVLLFENSTGHLCFSFFETDMRFQTLDHSVYSTNDSATIFQSTLIID